MSVRMIQLFKTISASPTQRLVAYMLADCHNEHTERCDPSISLLEETTSLSDRAIETAIKGLESAGHLTVLRRHGARNSYHLHPKTSELGSPDQRTCFPSPEEKPANLLRGTSEPPSGVPANLLPQTSEPPSPEPEGTGTKPEKNRKMI